MVSPSDFLTRPTRQLLLGLMLPLAALAAPSVQLSSEPLQAGVPFSLIIEADTEAEAGPDLAPLEQDFRILDRRISQHIMIQNGQRTRSRQWIITLLREQPGPVQIPALRLGSETTAALAIDLQAAPDPAAMEAEAVWLELEAQPESTYVQQQRKLVIRVMRRQGIDLDGATLSGPEFGNGDVVIEAIDKDRAYQIERDGRVFDVIERSYFLFPQSSGELLLQPIELLGRIVEGSASLFSPLGARFRSVRLQTPPQTLTVKPAPEGSTNAAWLPAEELLLTESWSSTEEVLTVGAAVSRTIGIVARGLTAAQLPDLTPTLPAGVRLYAEQPTLNNQKGADGVVGSRTLKLTILASEPGEYRIPEVKVPWFNLMSGKQEVATLAARNLRVLAAPEASGAVASEASSDLNPQEKSLAVAERNASDPRASEGLASKLPTLLCGLALGLGLGALLSRYSREPRLARETADAQASSNAKPASQTAWKQALAAARANQAERCRHAIVAAAPRWLGPGAQARSLAELAAALPPGALASEVTALARALYARGAGATSWDGRPLALALEREPVYRVSASTAGSALEALLHEP